MAISARSLLTTELSATIIAAARTTFLLVGIASTAIILASTVVPFSSDLLSSSLPRLKTLAFSFLSPSYLFITIHFIIIIIWKLHGSNHLPPDQNEAEIQYPSVPSEIQVPITDSVPDPPNSSETEPDESHDTMDATWKAIMERGPAEEDAAARPRMKKSDTWERCGRDRERSPAASMERRFRKSETFRRVSVGREELFGRAEAFIRTHYEQRRIQRQESEQRYIEMVNAAC